MADGGWMLAHEKIVLEPRWLAMVRHLEKFPVTVQIARIDGKRWAYVSGANTATAAEVTRPHRLQLDEHTGLILRGRGALTAAQQKEIEQFIAAAR